MTTETGGLDRLSEIRAAAATNGPDAEQVGWLLEHIEQLQQEAASSAAGLLYWNRRYVETAQQHAVDIAAKDAYRAERDEARAQRQAVLDLCDAVDVGPAVVLIRKVRTALGA